MVASQRPASKQSWTCSECVLASLRISALEYLLASTIRAITGLSRRRAPHPTQTSAPKVRIERGS